MTPDKKRIAELEEEKRKLLLQVRDLKQEIEYMKSFMPETESIEEKNEICSCGGTIIPMYDEHPNWIKFCNKCGDRTEDSNSSPILETV